MIASNWVVAFVLWIPTLPLVVCAEPPQEKIADLTKSLGSGDRPERVRAIQELASLQNLPKETIDRLIETARFEIASAISPKAFPRNSKPATELKLDGSETSLDRIKANPQDFFGRDLILCGAIETSDYFNYGFRNDSERYYSFNFVTFGANAQRLGRESTHLFLSRDIGGGLVEYMTQSKEAGYDMCLIRLRVIMRPERYQGADTWNCSMEITDWQLRDHESGGWHPWAFEGAAAAMLAIHRSGRNGVFALVDVISEAPRGQKYVDDLMRVVAIESLKAMDKKNLALANTRLIRAKRLNKNSSITPWIDRAGRAVQASAKVATKK